MYAGTRWSQFVNTVSQQVGDRPPQLVSTIFQLTQIGKAFYLCLHRKSSQPLTHRCLPVFRVEDDLCGRHRFMFAEMRTLVKRLVAEVFPRSSASYLHSNVIGEAASLRNVPGLVR